MSEPLSQRLAERLGCSPEAAAAALQQFTAQLRRQLEQEGQATITGLGRFVQTDEGLQFEPDASLAQAVNHRFAGLEPVTVEPPSEQSYRKTEVVSAETEVEEEPEASPFYEVKEIPTEPAPPSEVEATGPVEAEPPPEPEAEIQSEAEPEEEPEPAASEEALSAASTEPPLRPPRSPRIRVQEERRRGLPVWIPAALLIVVLGAVAVWFLFFSKPSGPVETASAPPSAVEAEGPTPPETTTATLPPVATDTTPAPEASSTEPPHTEAPASPTPATGNYALVVGSVTRRSAAEQIAARFRRALAEQDLPVTIVSATTDGTTRYRVAVGRYNSPEEALAAKRQLRDLLPSDAWVLRLPSTTQ